MGGLQGEDAQTLFEQLMDAAPVMIWASGTDKRCTWFNRRWLDFTGRTLAQERGDGWTEGVHPEDLKRCLETYVSHFDQGVPFRMEYRLRHAAGGYRWILDAGVPRYGADGTLQGYIGSCIDIDAIRQSGDKAASVDTVLDELNLGTGGVAQAFENLIAAFLGDLEAIQRSADNPDAVRRRVEEAEADAIQGKRAVEQLLGSMRNHLQSEATHGGPHVPETWKVL